MALRPAVLAMACLLGSCGSSTAQSSSSRATSASSTASSTTAPSTNHPARCGPLRGHTLAASARARVYSLRGSVYGCAGRRGKSYRLGSATTSIRQQRIGPVAVAGVDTAYGVSASGVDTASAGVVVRRLTDGKRLRTAAATTKPLPPEFIQSVDSIVLKTDGAVAWIGTVGSVVGAHSRDVEVHRSDRRGEALLDSGQAIDSRSLRLHGSTVSWRHADFTRGASLQ